jgi:hypothetical protein
MIRRRDNKTRHRQGRTGTYLDTVEGNNKRVVVTWSSFWRVYKEALNAHWAEELELELE